MIYLKKKDYFFKPSGNLEPSIIPATLKILAKLSPYIRQLDIEVKFSLVDESCVELEAYFESEANIKVWDKAQNQNEHEDLFFASQEGSGEFGMALEKKGAFEELFQIQVDNFEASGPG